MPRPSSRGGSPCSSTALAADSLLAGGPSRRRLALAARRPGRGGEASRASSRFLTASTTLRGGDKVFLMGTTDAVGQMQRRVGGHDDRGAARSSPSSGVATWASASPSGSRSAATADVRIVERDAGPGRRARRGAPAHPGAQRRRHRPRAARGRGHRPERRPGLGDRQRRAQSASRRSSAVSSVSKRVITRVSRQANLRPVRTGRRRRRHLGARRGRRGHHAPDPRRTSRTCWPCSRKAQAAGRRVAGAVVVSRDACQRACGRCRRRIIGAILRADSAIVPGGGDVIQGGDRLLVFTTTADSDAVREYFTRSA